MINNLKMLPPQTSSQNMQTCRLRKQRATRHSFEKIFLVMQNIFYSLVWNIHRDRNCNNKFLCKFTTNPKTKAKFCYLVKLKIFTLLYLSLKKFEFKKFLKNAVRLFAPLSKFRTFFKIENIRTTADPLNLQTVFSSQRFVTFV